MNQSTSLRILFLISLLICQCANGKNNKNRSAPTILPVITGTLPHDPEAFTQGFLYKDGFLLESTGLYGKSSIRKLNVADGAVVYKEDVPDVFAEGLAFFGNTIAQITWKEQIAITYEYPSMKPLGILKYSGEGWGLTTNTNGFIMSNGSDTLYFRAPDFKIVSKLPVTLNEKPVKNLNELEYARGSIYANVWYSDYIFEIDPSNGNVRRIIDCSALVRREQPRSQDCVLNGIAYNSTDGKFYITGKNWKTIFIVTIP